jgi:hypothetical protein
VRSGEASRAGRPRETAQIDIAVRPSGVAVPARPASPEVTSEHQLQGHDVEPAAELERGVAFVAGALELVALVQA